MGTSQSQDVQQLELTEAKLGPWMIQAKTMFQFHSSICTNTKSAF